MKKIECILLVGPTGSGKTPLGEYLERHGLWGRRCVHFDFGAQLRAVAAGVNRPGELKESEVEVIRRALASGALLEDHQFPVAAKILKGFAGQRGIAEGDWVVLNGLPRHVGQVRDLEPFVKIDAIISLRCTAEAVYERIRSNSGGDRAGRFDDDIEAVKRKLRLFAQRTEPIIEHCAGRGTGVYAITVDVKTRAEMVWEELGRAQGPGINAGSSPD